MKHNERIVAALAQKTQIHLKRARKRGDLSDCADRPAASLRIADCGLRSADLIVDWRVRSADLIAEC